MSEDALTPGEVELLVAGLSDEIALVWAQAKDYADWAFCCWLVNTEQGHRAALEARHQRR